MSLCFIYLAYCFSELLKKNGRRNEVEARKMFRQIIAAVEYLHQKRIVHRDLKVSFFPPFPPSVSFNIIRNGFCICWISLDRMRKKKRSNTLPPMCKFLNSCSAGNLPWPFLFVWFWSFVNTKLYLWTVIVVLLVSLSIHNARQELKNGNKKA